jgi:DNA repair protein RadC
MAIADWPEAERPREKLLAQGARILSDAELLAIFLRTGVSGKTALDVARDLLTAFGGLRPLLEASEADFCQAKGTGPVKYVQIQAALELGRRYLETTLLRSDALTSPSATRAYLCANLKPHPYEVFACLFLDNRHRVICFEEMFRGTIDGASVHPREVVRRALKHNAAAVILAHNRYSDPPALSLLACAREHTASCP